MNLVKCLSVLTLLTFVVENTPALALSSEPLVRKMPLTSRHDGKAGLLATVRVQGTTFQLLVDTGSSGHILESRIVKKLGLRPIGQMGGSTPYGSVQMAHLGDIKAKLGNVTLDLLGPLTDLNASPGGLENDGISGLLSPPALAINSLVVLDAKEPALYFVTPVPADIREWLSRHFKNASFDQVPRLDDPDSYRELILVKSSTFGELPMFLDSGATTTNIYSDSTVAKAKPLTLSIQNHECVTANARIRPTTTPPSTHLLGMDCLRGKILAFAPKGSRLVWIGWPQNGSPSLQ